MPSGFATAGAGAELTAEQVAAVLIEPLLASSVVLSSGPRMFESRGGVPVRVPKITVYSIGDNAASAVSEATYWFGENEEITEQDPTYGELTLLPSSLKSVKVLHRFSNELARHSVVNIANALRDAIVTRVRLALDRAFLVGDGDGLTTVRGIVNFPGVQEDTFAGATPVVDDLHDAMNLALAADASPSVWFTTPGVFTALRKQRENEPGGDGQYLITPDPTEGNVYRLVGLPVRVTTQLPADTLILADMSQVAVARDLDVSVKLLDQTFGDYDQLAIRVVTRWDIGLLNAEGVVVLTAAGG